MPDLKDLLPDTPDDDRIRKWREERLRVAEEEKAERLRQRDIERAKKEQHQSDQEARIAAALLPTQSEIADARMQIARRQTRGRLRILTRFALICVLPMLAALAYLTMFATPLYESRSVIAVTKAATGTDTSQSGLLGSLNTPSGLQEVFMAHEYIQSQALMDSLEAETGLVTRLSGPDIDPVQRLRDLDALKVSKQDQFSRFVDSAVDIQTGLISVYVRTPEPSESVAVSDRVLTLVAERVNALNSDVIGQRLMLAENAVQSAQDQLTQAQTDLIKLQLESGEANPAERIEGVYSLINQLESEALTLGSEIQRAQVAGQGDSFQTLRAVELVARLRAQIDTQRAVLVADTDESLNTLMMQHQLAALRVRIAEESLTSSLTAQVKATNTAALASSLFQVVVPPRTSTIPSAPNAPVVLLLVLVGSLAVFALWGALASGRQSV